MIRSAPWSFALFLIVGSTLSFGASTWYYSKRLEDKSSQIADKDGQIDRYRVVLGIKPGSAGALVDLNNEELALRAQSIVAKIRQLGYEMDAKIASLNKQLEDKKLDKSQFGEQEWDVFKEVSQEFDSSLASDADNMRNELRKRLDPSAIAHVVRVPAFNAQNGTSIPLTSLLRGTNFDTFYMRRLADEIEQMAKLLPPDSRKSN